MEKMRPPAAGLLPVLFFAASAGSVCLAQATSAKKDLPEQTLCNSLTKAEAESILGEPVVQQASSPLLCRYIQNGYAGGTGPNNKQVSLAIAHSQSPSAEGVKSRRAAIARDTALEGVEVRDVTDFADAALWSWTTRWGRLNAFKSGNIEAQVTVAGIDEAPALQNAIKLATRLLGGSVKTGYAYTEWPSGSTQTISASSLTAPGAPSGNSAGSKTIRGTVSRVAVDFDKSPHWLSIFLKEYPESSFVVCSPDPQMVRETTVADLFTLVGKTIEVTGQVEKSQCSYAGQADSIRVLDPQHYRVQMPPQEARRAVTADSAPTRPAPRAGLNICNDGKVDFDAFAQIRQAGVTSAHIVPGDCVRVYEGTGTPAYVGLGFADSRGQWGAPHRLDLLPNDAGSENAPNKLWARADARSSVKHGGGNVTLPMQLLFSPQVPVCRAESSGENGVIGANAQETQKIKDAIRAQNATNPQATACDSFEYTLNVVAYPDTHEVTFRNKCFACPHPPTATPADIRKGVEKASKLAPVLGAFMQFAGQVAATDQDNQLRESVDGPPDPEHMNWDGMNKALGFVRPALGRPPEMPRHLSIRGTISRVDVSAPGASAPWVNVWFRESSEQRSNAFETFYGPFNACASSPEIFEDAFGPDFRTRMIGQVVELEGEFQRNYCKGWKGSVRISLAHQIRKVANLDPADIKAQAKQ
jgi:hypothetical protein